MKRSDILRRLNNINIQIGKLMEEKPSFALNMKVNNSEGNRFGGYNQNIKKLAERLISGERFGNDEKDDIVNVVAYGYENELKDAMNGIIERDKKFNKDGKIEKGKIDQFHKVLEKINKMKAKRDGLSGELDKQIKDARNAGNDEMEKVNKDAMERDKASNEQSIKNNANNRQSCIISALIWFAVAIAIAIFFGPAIINQIRKAGSLIMTKGLGAWNTIKECLKACLGVAVIAAPIIIGILELLEIRNLSDPNYKTDTSGTINSIKREMEQKVLGICVEFETKLREEL